MHPQLQYRIALTLIPGIGPVKAKNLLAYCGSAEAIFKEKQSSLLRIPEIGGNTADSIFSIKKEALLRAEKEILFMEEHGIKAVFHSEPEYPIRLRQCDDSPIILYSRGKIDFNAERIISIVGTRNATPYGIAFVKELLTGIAHLKPLVVSGLAYGIDIHVHRQCLQLGLPTAGVIAHGLEMVYPALHTQTAREMEANGGLISEFVTHTKMAPELFPMRNRIVAGMADCTIVIESGKKGGSLITAHLANSYGREVFALPGRYNDKLSSGCNELIRKNIAAILTSADDLMQYMNWDEVSVAKPKQLKLIRDYSIEEQQIINLLSDKGKLQIDQLAEYAKLSNAKLSNILLTLEFDGVIKSLPGKVFELE